MQCRTKADAHDKKGFQYISISVYIVRSHARIQREGAEGPDPPPPPPRLKNHKNIEFLRNTGPDPLKFLKLPSQHSTLGHRRADDGPLLVIFGSSLPYKRKKKRCQKSDPDPIRMEFRKEYFANLNIWACDRKHAKHHCRISDFVVQKPMRTRSISKNPFQHPYLIFF